MADVKVKTKAQTFAALSPKDKRKRIGDILLNNAMYIIILLAVIYISIKVPAFLGLSSIVNVISLTAAKLPIALGIGGCIVLTGTDISAGIILMYLKNGTNNGQTLSGLSEGYRSLVTGTLLKIGNVAVPMYVLYAVILTVIMWIIWNKTTFGKNMFAVGSNEEAANVSGVNVSRTIILVFMLAGVMYSITGFLDSARIASANASTGWNYECDAIAACVIGGVSFVGGIGRISGIVVGVLLLQIIFAGLNFLSVDANMLYIIKGLIILIACAIDMRKYLVRK